MTERVYLLEVVVPRGVVSLTEGVHAPETNVNRGFGWRGFLALTLEVTCLEGGTLAALRPMSGKVSNVSPGLRGSVLGQQGELILT